LPADHDDDDGGAARRGTAGVRQRDRIGAAPAAGHLHHRRTAGQPGADALHDAGHLSLLRSHRCEAGTSMSLSTPFIQRPVATTLFVAGLTLAGGLAYTLLPVSALPAVDSPTITVFAGLPGASPDVMAASVATPLEKQFTRIAGVTEMTSNSSVGSAQLVLQFDLSRDINAAAREVQAAINSAAGTLPTNLPSLPRYRKINPADQPILLMTLESD